MLTIPRSTPTNPLLGDQRVALRGDSDGGVQEPFAVPEDQVGFRRCYRLRNSARVPRRSEDPVRCATGRVRTRSTRSLPVRRICAVGYLPRQAPCVERLCSVVAETGSACAEHLCAACRARRTVVAGGDVAHATTCIRFGDLADHADRRLRRQLESMPQLGGRTAFERRVCGAVRSACIRADSHDGGVVGHARRVASSAAASASVGSMRSFRTCFMPAM